MACQICGKSSGFYPLCNDCFKLRDNGKLKKCNDCGKWYEINKKCNCQITEEKIGTDNKNTNSKLTCITCGETTDKIQCKNCYNETKEFMSNLDKNDKAAEFRDHYFNLKDSIFRMTNFEYVKRNCNRLIAISMLNEKVNSDKLLAAIVYKDVEKLISKKKEFNQNAENINIVVNDKDEQKEENNRTQDGHYVESHTEVTIDDILYNAMIPHSYGQLINEISEKRKKADWFIPVLGTNKGIYIEYWGMDTEQYNKDRKEKEELYEKNEVAYIGIEKDDPKRDLQGFKNNLIRELREKALKHYKTKPNW